MIDLYYWHTPNGWKVSIRLDEFPNVARWREAINTRPAARAGVDLGEELQRQGPPSEEKRRILFGQR